MLIIKKNILVTLCVESQNGITGYDKAMRLNPMDVFTSYYLSDNNYVVYVNDDYYPNYVSYFEVNEKDCIKVIDSDLTQVLYCD